MCPILAQISAQLLTLPRRLVVKAQDALLAVTVIHSNVLRIPLHSEQESNFIKGAQSISSRLFRLPDSQLAGPWLY